MCLFRKSSVGVLAILLVATVHGQASPFIEKLPSVTEDEAVEEPDYAVVAADARKIADEIDRRLIESHMTDAADKLAVKDAPTGHEQAEAAYLDMKEMIKVCESTGGGAGAACKFQLEIKMGMNAGNTLGQLRSGMRPGSSGLGGMSGRGSSGSSGGQNFGVYGPDDLNGKNNEKSRLLGNRKKNSDAAEEGPGDLARNVDEVAAAKKADIQFNASGGERVLEEYRGQVNDYFKRIAAEEAAP